MDTHVLYESKFATVTRRIVRIGDTSYQMSNIFSVAVTERPRLHAVAIFLAAAGIVALGIAYAQYGQDQQMTLWAAGAGVLALVVAMIWQNFWPKREYKLVLTSPGGEAYAVTSNDKELFKLKAAIEEAFATARG